MTFYNHFGLRNDVLTHPNGYASYAVPVRQYRYLQSRLLQCMDHSTPPCGLLMLRVVTPHIRDFHSLASIKELYSSFRAHTRVLPIVGLDVGAISSISLSAL